MPDGNGAEAERELEVLLGDEDVFEPPPEFIAQANASDPAIYDEAERDPEGWWESWAQKLDWAEPWSKVLDWSPPWAKWFVDGKLNVSHNCLDRHVDAGNGERVAFHWEGEDEERRDITYAELLDTTKRFANVLKDLGVERDDRVAIYMPMIPEAPAAMLACARIGAPHSVVFGGFSPESVKDRIVDCGAKVLITADFSLRKGKPNPMKEAVDPLLEQCSSIEHVVVVRRTGGEVPWTEGRDVWWHDAVEQASPDCPAEPFDAEQMLFLLYTSGTTAKPKGIVHTSGGYLTGAMATHNLVFDIKPDKDVYWCSADIGWVTGHSYIVYGPLANGCTSILYEGAPDFPDKDRWWAIAERYKCTIFYTAPTAVRACMKWGREYPDKHDLSSIRLLGSVGEPINPRAWLWYHEVIGGGRCPVVDTWWQTETGHIMITPLPALTRLKPGSATTPFPGIRAAIYDTKGKEVDVGGGILVLTRPWPGMFRTLYNEPERYVDTYWSRYGPDVYVVGDAARRDADGYFWVVGRTDDVINVSGHRLSTMEVESACVSHPNVAEAAVVPEPDETTGQAIVAFVTMEGGGDPARRIRQGTARARRGQDRQARASQAFHLGRGPAEDALRQDHAPAAEGHRLGSGDGRRHDPARPDRHGHAEGEGGVTARRGVTVRGRVLRALVTGMLLVLMAGVSSAEATFSGQNGKIAFSNFDLSTDTWQVISMNPDGSGQTPLRTGLQPEWSPDGRDLLFIDDASVKRMPADGSSEMVLLEGEGLPNGSRWWQTPAWSPDGSRIVASFIDGEPGSFFTELYTARSTDGLDRQHIADGQSPSWKPDGSLIAFSAHTSNGNAGALHLVNPDGTGEDPIVEPFGLEPDYSPDGTKIVFSAYPAGGSVREIYVYTGAGTPLRLTNNLDHDGDPVWSPDGTKIAFRSDRHGESAIYTMNANGTNPTRITNDPDYQAEPSWQPLHSGYVRPKGASPVRVPLVPAFAQCTAPNRTHGAPLSSGSCDPPTEQSSNLTVGTSMNSFVSYRAVTGSPIIPEDEADIAVRVELTDVRVKSTLADYAGEVQPQATMRLTDRGSGGPATVSDMTLPLPTQCTPTAATNVGSTCSLTTTLDTLIPGAIVEGRRSLVQLAQVQVIDGGPDGDIATEPNQVFLRQGIFVP